MRKWNEDIDLAKKDYLVDEVLWSYDSGLETVYHILFKWCQKQDHFTGSCYITWNGKGHFLLVIQPGMSRDSSLLFCLNSQVLQFKTPCNVESKALLKPNVRVSLLSLLFTDSLILSEELGWPAIAHFSTLNISMIQSYIIVLEAMLWNIHTILGSSQVKVNQVSVKWMLRF